MSRPELYVGAGEKYLDTIFDDAWLTERGLLDPTAEQRVHQWLDAYAAPIPTSGDDVA